MGFPRECIDDKKCDEEIARVLSTSSHSLLIDGHKHYNSIREKAKEEERVLKLMVTAIESVLEYNKMWREHTNHYTKEKLVIAIPSEASLGIILGQKDITELKAELEQLSKVSMCCVKLCYLFDKRISELKGGK